MEPLELYKKELTPTLFYYLWSIVKREEFPWDISEEKKEIVEKMLVEGSWIDTEYNLRPKTIKLFRSLEVEIKEGPVVEKSVDDFVNQFIKLWPTQSETRLPRIVRPSYNNIQPKLVKWLKANKKYSEKEVLFATKRYLDEQKRDGYRFCMGGDNFVYKFKDSYLLTYLDNLELRGLLKEIAEKDLIKEETGEDNGDDGEFIIKV